MANTWPPPRVIQSTGVAYTVIALPHLGREWSFVYWYLEADRG